MIDITNVRTCEGGRVEILKDADGYFWGRYHHNGFWNAGQWHHDGEFYGRNPLLDLEEKKDFIYVLKVGPEKLECHIGVDAPATLNCVARIPITPELLKLYEYHFTSPFGVSTKK